MAFRTIQHNLIDKSDAFDWPSWLPIMPMDIRYLINNYKEELMKFRETIDIVVGGPPCQGFSVAGRRQEHDERNKMFKEYVRFVELAAPKMIFFENVPGFASPFKKDENKGVSYADLLSNELAGIGYEFPKQLKYDFSDFGVPQSRKRLIIFASEKGTDPSKFHDILSGMKGASKKIGVENAISDLLRENGEVDSPDSPGFKAGVYGKPNSPYQKKMRIGTEDNDPDSHRFANHSKRIVERFEIIVNSQNSARNWTKEYMKSLNLKKRDLTALNSTLPSPTLTTLPDDHLHYKEARILTVREYGRLQSFPDSFEFKGKYTTGGKLRALEAPRYSQVANAVPPEFAKKSGDALKKLL